MGLWRDAWQVETFILKMYLFVHLFLDEKGDMREGAGNGRLRPSAARLGQRLWWGQAVL
jgi:hypothetical protein